MPASVRVHRLGASLRLGGDEFLALPGGVRAYRRVRTTGLPLLAPWANRLSQRAYRTDRVRVDLDGLDLNTDPNGLPIHGMLSARQAWEVRAVSAGGRTARLRAGFEYAGAELLAAFPFPHRLETTIDVDDRSLSVATTVLPSSDRPVPVCFGYHPYLPPPGRPASGVAPGPPQAPACRAGQGSASRPAGAPRSRPRPSRSAPGPTTTCSS